MKLKIYLFLLVLFNLNISFSQSWIKVGARQASLGGCSITNSDIYGLWNNQASTGFLNEKVVALAYNNRFLLSELSTKSFGFVYPTKYGNPGIAISDYGFKNYNEKMISLSYSRLFLNKLSVGFAIDYIHLRQGQEYGSTSIATIEAGFIYKVDKKLTFGCHVFNPTMKSFKEDALEKLSTVFSLGLAYSPIDGSMIFLELEKDVNFNPRVLSGIEYEIKKKISLRAGFANNPVETSFGLGYNLRKLNLELAFVNNYQLGLSSVISINLKL